VQPISIRAFAPADLDAVADLWHRARVQAMPALEARAGHTTAEDREHLLGSVIPTHRLFVAERRGAVVGFASLEGEVLGHLYVAPEAQRRGVGAALLAHVKALARDRLTLFTHRANRRARAFYESRGFRAVRYGTSPAPENEPDVAYEWTRRPVRDPAVVLRRIVLIVALTAWAVSFVLPMMGFGQGKRLAGYQALVLGLATILTGWPPLLPLVLAVVATAWLPVHLIRALRGPPSRRGVTCLGLAVGLGLHVGARIGFGRLGVLFGYWVWLGAFALTFVERLLPRGRRPVNPTAPTA